jgi:hypothetical protein
MGLFDDALGPLYLNRPELPRSLNEIDHHHKYKMREKISIYLLICVHMKIAENQSYLRKDQKTTKQVLIE